MDILHWHLFTREELLGFAERAPETLVDIVLALQERVVRLQEQNQQQHALIAQLVGRIERLEAQLHQDSHNSHQPPSSDGYAKPAPKSLRETSDRPAGGQRGHVGHTLKVAAHPDFCIVHRLVRCPKGHSLREQPVLGYEKRQVFDLPVQALEVQEHRAETKYCPTCQEPTTAVFPSGLEAPVQYGPRYLAFLAYLRDVQLLPAQRIGQMSEDLFGQPVSPATVEGAVERAAEAITPFQDVLEADVSQATQLHADETGLRVNGKIHWLHVLSTPKLTWYGVHPKRGRDAMEDFGLLPGFRGRLIHDEFGPYWTYGREHVLCNAHHLRELVFCAEEEHQRWAARLKHLLVHAERRRQKQGSFTPSQVHHVLERYRHLLTGTSPPPKSKAHRLRRRLIKYERFVLAQKTSSRK